MRRVCLVWGGVAHEAIIHSMRYVSPLLYFFLRDVIKFETKKDGRAYNAWDMMVVFIEVRTTDGVMITNVFFMVYCVSSLRRNIKLVKKGREL